MKLVRWVQSVCPDRREVAESLESGEKTECLECRVDLENRDSLASLETVDHQDLREFPESREVSAM